MSGEDDDYIMALQKELRYLRGELAITRDLLGAARVALEVKDIQIGNLAKSSADWKRKAKRRA